MTRILELGYWQFVFWWTVGLAAAGWVWVLFADEKRKLWWDGKIGWWIWHWYSGGELEPDKLNRHDDALVPRLLDRFTLGLARTSCIAGFLATIYATTTPGVSPRQILVYSYGGAIGLGAITLVVAHGAVRMALSMWWARPLHDAIYAMCGWDEGMAPRRYLNFDRVHELGLALTVYCHPSVKMDDTNVDKIVDAVRKKLGTNIEHVPDWIGRASELVFRPASLIPDEALFFDPEHPDEITNVRRLIEAAPPSKILLGLAADGVPFYMDLDTESAHFLVSAGTGGGKSETLKSVAAQALWHGARVFILDPRRNSHIWARDLPGIHIEVDPAAIHTGLLKLAEEVDRRTAETDHLRVGDPIPDFQRVVVVVEELGTLFDELKAWWREQGHRLEPPSMRALRKLLRMGRFLKIHVVAGNQRFDAIQTGGGGARENYSWRGIAEHTSQTVDMLAKGAPVEPKTAEDKRGRMQIVRGVDVTEIRRVWMSPPTSELPDGDDRPMVAWLTGPGAATGKSFLNSSALPDDNHLPLSPPQATTSGSAVAPTDTPSIGEIAEGEVLRRTDDGQGYVTLQEIVDLGIIPRALKTVRVYSGRSWFPAPAEKGTGPYGHKYHEPAVRKAWATRPRIPENQDYYRPVVYGMVKGGRLVVEQALRGELTGVQAKIGYTFRDTGERAKEVQMRPKDVVAVVDVPAAKPGQPLPDKAFHRDFWVDKVDKNDPDDEWFWVRPDGPVARWLQEVSA